MQHKCNQLAFLGEVQHFLNASIETCKRQDDKERLSFLLQSTVQILSEFTSKADVSALLKAQAPQKEQVAPKYKVSTCILRISTARLFFHRFSSFLHTLCCTVPFRASTSTLTPCKSSLSGMANTRYSHRSHQHRNLTRISRYAPPFRHVHPRCIHTFCLKHSVIPFDAHQHDFSRKIFSLKNEHIHFSLLRFTDTRSPSFQFAEMRQLRETDLKQMGTPSEPTTQSEPQ